LFDGEQVVVNRPLPIGGGQRWKKTTPAQRNHLKPGLACPPADLGQLASLYRLTPESDAAHAPLRKRLETLLKRELLGGDCVNAEPGLGSGVCEGYGRPWQHRLRFKRLAKDW
jgi:hypothetical protein